MCLLIIYVYICINSSFIFIGLRIDYPYICIGYNTIVCTVYGFKYLLEFVDMLTYLCRSLACEELSNGRAVEKNWSAKRVLFLDHTVHLVLSKSLAHHRKEILRQQLITGRGIWRQQLITGRGIWRAGCGSGGRTIWNKMSSKLASLPKECEEGYLWLLFLC